MISRSDVEVEKRPQGYRVTVPDFGSGEYKVVFEGRNFAYARKKARAKGRYARVEFFGDTGWHIVYEVY